MREEEKETRGVRITRFIFGRHNGEIRRQDQRKIEEFDIESESALASETAFEQYAGQRSGRSLLVLIVYNVCDEASEEAAWGACGGRCDNKMRGADRWGQAP